MFNRLLQTLGTKSFQRAQSAGRVENRTKAEGYPLPTHDVAVRPSYFTASIHADDLIGRSSAVRAF